MIVVVVVFSALSFTLGYFVGKSGPDGQRENLSGPHEVVLEPQTRGPVAPLQQQEVPVPENRPLYEENAEEQVQPRQEEASVGVGAKEAGPAKGVRAVKENSGPQAAPQQMPEEDLPETAAKKHIASGEDKKTGTPVYTVQIGAFKSSGEAEACRKKQAIKKLKTYITTSTNKKKEKIYKVRTGEFRDRKSAEVLSLKLSKTEKLKTFVTLKNE
jgi:cell division protein FtsN